MRDKLLSILNNYIPEKNKTFKNNDLEKLIRLDVKEDLYNNFNIDNNNYQITGSAGVGRWANIPWVSIFDKDITKTAQKGYYIVYLFCADMSGVYLSLNQGWTYFKDKYSKKEAKENIKTLSNIWRSYLSSRLEDFPCDTIDLKSTSKTSDLANGYELGHICGKFYPKENIPDDTELLRDINNLLGVYRELKGKLKETVNKTNDLLLLDHKIGLPNNDIFDESDTNELESIIDKVDDISLIEIEVPSNFLNNSKNHNFKPKKINFYKKYKNQKKIGHLGEKMVLNYEKNYLIKNNREDLANKVKHISEEEGDGAGYDILSYDLDGSVKYIEVKTTIGKGNSPFYISSNELEFSIINKDNFYLYRVCEFNKEKNSGNLFKFKGNLMEALDIEVIQYVVNGIKNS